MDEKSSQHKDQDAALLQAITTVDANADAEDLSPSGEDIDYSLTEISPTASRKKSIQNSKLSQSQPLCWLPRE